MAKQVKSIVITGYGTNCEVEMAHACKLAGSEVVDIVHVSEILCGKIRLDDYHFLNLPGGFLDGDYLGSAKAATVRFLHARIAHTHERLFDQLSRFIRDGKLVLGVCNGFQLQVKLGLLPALEGELGTQTVTLTYNDSGRFEDRWVYLKVNPLSPCIFTRGLDGLYLPVRHGEGKFLPRDEEILRKITERNLIALQYSDASFQQPVMTYPGNPNGSVLAIAGICNETGRIFGLMPHPEAYLHRTNHPRWTREEVPEEGMGLALFRNAISFIRNELL
ncbi:MAG TPA: phosphoribosylformylglycinamidine synthase subunit PurQ [Syntrophales bacterium]|nr:phosphoribosylformylglycinamidine synthase subunit PurQ [Syntrophales bacterium]HOL59408.1 phosphoribosylformylglycinamidine synthase subunit PurQ [Syntrophales bacterium]HPO35565.1 phosphoribosylformylglycinamidine synthase subunit PurQ [Syntrophales bacterium]